MLITVTKIVHSITDEGTQVELVGYERVLNPALLSEFKRHHKIGFLSDGEIPKIGQVINIPDEYLKP